MFKVILSFGSCFRCQFRSFSLFHRVFDTTGLSELFSPFPYANDLELHKLIWYNTGYSCCLPRKHFLYLGSYNSYVCHWWVVHSNTINVISDQLSMFKGHKAETRWPYLALSYFIKCVTVCNSIKQFGLKKRNVIITQRSNTTASLSLGSFVVKKRHSKHRTKRYKDLLKRLNYGTLWNCLILSAKTENIRKFHNLKIRWSLTSHCTCLHNWIQGLMRNLQCHTGLTVTVTLIAVQCNTRKTHYKRRLHKTYTKTPFLMLGPSET